MRPLRTWRRDLKNLIKSQEDLEAGRSSKYLDRLACLRRAKTKRAAWLLEELGESADGETAIADGPLSDKFNMFTRNEERKR